MPATELKPERDCVYDQFHLPSVASMWDEAKGKQMARLHSLNDPEVELFLATLLEEIFYTSFGFCLQAVGHAQSLPAEGERRMIERMMEQQMEGIRRIYSHRKEGFLPSKV
jgi:hypothetical protein